MIDFKPTQTPFAPRDHNRDGYLDPQELPGLANYQKLALGYDLDHDGKLSPTEYRASFPVIPRYQRA